MVHGDFRAANIMLKRGEADKVVLIDYDWAGKAGGDVRYPITRSDGLVILERQEAHWHAR